MIVAEIARNGGYLGAWSLTAEMPEFEAVTAFQAGGARVSVRRQDADTTARPLRSEYVTGNYFSTLGVNAFTGRVFTAADVDGWRLVNVHRTRPGWSRGGAAFAEEYDRLLDLARRTDGPLVVAGDQNIGTRKGRDRAAHTPWALARAIGARIVTTKPGVIDYAIARGARGRAKRLGKYGSDHHAYRFDLTKE